MKVIYVVLCILLIGLLICFSSKFSDEKYEPGDYYQMSHLPWVTPPTGGPDSLGYIEANEVKRMYPGQKFYTGKIPVSCPPSGIRIYETGNALNPNVQSYIGLIQPPDIRY